MGMIDREKIANGLRHCLHYKGSCFDCPYDGPNCQNDVLDDAIALLKELEPRVLNWDEVENYSVVYGEFRGVKEIFPLIITKDMFGRTLSWNPGINRSGECFLLVSDEEDKRNTRCWNIKPTDEQREAVKWE